jgi:predicted MFS family arabinose efflux permease
MNDNSASPLRLALGGAVAMGCAMGIGRFVYTPVLPFMAEAIPLTASQAGLIASANFLGYLLGALATAFRLPGAPKLWLLGALIASAVTTGAVGLSPSVMTIAGLRFLGGMASAFALVFASSLVLEGLAKAGRASLTWVHFAGVGIFIALSSQVIRLPVGWDGMWIVSGVVSLIGVVVVGFLVPGRPVAQAATERGTPAGADRGGLIRLAVAYGLFGFGYVITATFLIAIVRAQPSLRAFESIAWLVVGLAAAPSVLIWVTIGRRIGLESAYALSCAVEAAGVLFSLWNTTAGILLSAILLGGTFVGITALGLQAARARAVGDPRRALGLMTTAFSVGQIVGPSLAGYLRDLTGSFSLPTVFAAAALLVATGLTLKPAAASGTAGRR